MPDSSHRKGTIAFGIFLFFGAAMASFAGMTLLRPGTVLDRAWSFNPDAHIQLTALGRWIGIPFLLLACTLALAGVGWFRQRLWGWRLAVVIIATQVVGGLVRIVTGRFLEGFVALFISAALLAYLSRPLTRAVFAS